MQGIVRIWKLLPPEWNFASIAGVPQTQGGRQRASFVIAVGKGGTGRPRLVGACFIRRGEGEQLCLHGGLVVPSRGRLRSAITTKAVGGIMAVGTGVVSFWKFVEFVGSSLGLGSLVRAFGLVSMLVRFMPRCPTQGPQVPNGYRGTRSRE